MVNEGVHSLFTIRHSPWTIHPQKKATMNSRLLPVGLIALLVVAGCRSNAQPVQTTPPTPVRIAQVTRQARTVPIRTSGRLAPKTQMQLSFKIGGLIDRFLVDEGSRVRAGRLLARLDMAEIDAQMQQAQSSFAKAERDAARMEALYRDSVATLEQLQNTQTAMEVTQSSLRIARFNRRHAEIYAPADGHVLRRLAEVHELVTPGEAVLVFGAAQGWVVRVGLSDRDVVKLRANDKAELHFDAYPDQAFEGWVSEIAEAADPTGGTFEVEVSVADATALLKAGFIARVDLFPSDAEPLFIIPIEALVEGDGREGIVYAVSDTAHIARRTPIRIAQILDDEIAVTAGMESATAVVIDGAPYLADGARIEVVRGQ